MAEAPYLESPLSPQGDEYFKVSSPPVFLNGAGGKGNDPSIYSLHGHEFANLDSPKQDEDERRRERLQETCEDDTEQEQVENDLGISCEPSENVFSLQEQSDVRQEWDESSLEISHEIDHENISNLPEQSGFSIRLERDGRCVDTSGEKDDENVSGLQEQNSMGQVQEQDERTPDFSQETADDNFLSAQEQNGVSLALSQDLEQENAYFDGQEIESRNLPSIPGLENARVDDSGQVEEPSIHSIENPEVSELDNPPEPRSVLNIEEQEDLGLGSPQDRRSDPSSDDQEDEDLDNLQDHRSVFSIEDMEVRRVDDLEDQDDSSSDIIIEDDTPSRASSPEIEVIEVRKSATYFTVDLTGDDDEDDQMDVDPIVCETVRPDRRPSPPREPQGSNAPLLDISNEDIPPPTCSRIQQEPEPVVSSSFAPCTTSSYTNDVQSGSSHSQPHTTGGTSYDGHWKKSMASGYGIKQEHDAISMMLELESFVSQGRSSQHSSSSYDINSFYHSHSDLYRYPSASTSAKFALAESSSSGTSSTGYASGSVRCGTSQIGNSTYDSPVDMTLPEGRAIKKEPVAFNSYGVPPTSVPFMEGSSQSSSGLQLDGVAYDIIDLALKKTGLTSSDFKTPIASHPNSAFQAVTPSTSGAVVSDPMEFLNRPNIQAAAGVMSSSVHTWNEASVSYTSSQSVGTTGNQLLNSNIASSAGSGASTSQGIDGPLQSFLTGLATGTSPPYTNSGSSNVGVRVSQNSSSGYTSNNFQSSYVAGPSTSTGSSSHGGSSAVSQVEYSSDPQQSPHLSSLIFVLPPSTGEQSSSFTSLSQHSTNSSLTSSNAVAVAASSSGRTSNSDRNFISSLTVLEDPPSPAEPTFSCNICLDSVKTIKSSSRNLCSTVCGHVFCSSCLEASLKRKKECPMCRKKLGKKQYHPLFV